MKGSQELDLATGLETPYRHLHAGNRELVRPAHSFALLLPSQALVQPSRKDLAIFTEPGGDIWLPLTASTLHLLLLVPHGETKLVLRTFWAWPSQQQRRTAREARKAMLASPELLACERVTAAGSPVSGGIGGSPGTMPGSPGSAAGSEGSARVWSLGEPAIRGCWRC